MTKQEHGGQAIPQEIQALLEQRGTFQQWLQRLGEVSGNFRPEVTRKVRADYQDRLQSVEEELAGHRSVMESALHERQNQVTDLADRHDARAADLEEAQLRHEVGEFANEEWGRLRDEHQAVLGDLEESLARERAAVSELEGILGELAGAPAAAAGVGAAVTEIDAEPTWETSEAPGPAEASSESADAETAATAVEEPQPERVETAVKVVADEGDEFMDELEFLESLSLDDTESFDAVSAMLEDEEEGLAADDSGPDER